MFATPSTRDESLLASPATTNETSGSPNSTSSVQHDAENCAFGDLRSPLLTLSEIISSLREAQDNDKDVLAWMVECKRRHSFPLIYSEKQCVTLLSCIKLSCARESALLWLTQEKILTEHVEEAVLSDCGPIEQCFDLEFERERVKALMRIEMLTIH